MKKNETVSIFDFIEAKNIIAGCLFGSCMIGLYGVVMILH